MEGKKIWQPGDPVAPPIQEINSSPKKMIDPNVVIKHMALVIEALLSFLNTVFVGFNKYYGARQKFGDKKATGDEEVKALNELVNIFNDVKKEIDTVLEKKEEKPNEKRITTKTL
ncbi:MAG TPA: hypothetical protein ENH82_18155 [bacterium]|nr:hypothetical protein [bacterium]